VLVVVVLVVAIGASAFAYWSAAGAGAGSGSTASAAPVTLSPGAVVADLRPGGAGDVVLTVTNPNAFDAELTSLALDVTQGDDGFGVDAAHLDCALTVLAYTTQTNGDAGWLVPAASGGDAGTLSITLPSALAMSDDAARGCQGATLTVYLTAGA
jgi:hypothetical protein